MPYSDLHKRKKFKNYALLAFILALVVIFFVMGMIKFHSLWAGSGTGII